MSDGLAVTIDMAVRATVGDSGSSACHLSLWKTISFGITLMKVDIIAMQGQLLVSN